MKIGKMGYIGQVENRRKSCLRDSIVERLRENMLSVEYIDLVCWITGKCLFMLIVLGFSGLSIWGLLR